MLLFTKNVFSPLPGQKRGVFGETNRVQLMITEVIEEATETDYYYFLPGERRSKV